MHLKFFLQLAVISIALAANCNVNQKRQMKKPSGGQIKKALGMIGDICNSPWRSGDEKEIREYVQPRIIERTESSVPLNNCAGALYEIVDQCIEGGGFWGGSSASGGEHYNISNSIYPHNPLIPEEEGGPSSWTPVEGICHLPMDKPDTFIDGHAAQYLQDFLSSHIEGRFTIPLPVSESSSEL